MTQSERVNLELQHQPCDGWWNGFTHATGVTQEDVLLKCCQLCGIDALVGENTKPGVDAVVGTPILQCSNNGFPGSVHAGMRTSRFFCSPVRKRASESSKFRMRFGNL